MICVTGAGGTVGREVIKQLESAEAPFRAAYFSNEKAVGHASLGVGSGRMFESTVQRTDWHEERELFVVACQYSNKSLAADDYDALESDPDWQMRPLI